MSSLLRTKSIDALIAASEQPAHRLKTWLRSWSLILEYAFSNMSVAVGFSAYFNDILDNLFGFHLPKQLSDPMIVEGQFTGSWFNLPALLVLMVLSYVLVRGVRESAGTNNAMVLI